jgi:hypothetical protein
VKAAVYGGRLTGYAAPPPPAAFPHPDSPKYFARAGDPSAAPVDVFNGHADAWRVPGAPYHGSLAAGDNTLTGRLVARLAASVVGARRVDAGAWLAGEYVRALAGAPGAVHADTWVDETHRVFFANVAAGAAPEAAGMDDACLAGLALATPALLAYCGSRDAGVTAARAVLQFTHKSEAMAEQAGWWGDLLAAVLGGVAARVGGGGGCGGGGGVVPVARALAGACTTFSDGRTDLPALLASGVSDEAAYHGSPPVFSSR